MNLNTYQTSNANKLNVPQNENHIISNPAMHYQSNFIKNPVNKTPQMSPHNYNQPSSINQNFLNVTPKYAPQRLSPYHGQTKGSNFKTSEINTAKSMVFMGTDKPPMSSFNPKKSFNGLSKLQTMARQADKNFDDSKDFQTNKLNKQTQHFNHFQSEKQFKTYGNSFQKQSPIVKKSFINPSSNFSSNFSTSNQQRSNVYKSFINDNGLSAGQKSNGVDFFAKFKKEQQQRRLKKQQSNNPTKLQNHLNVVNHHEHHQHPRNPSHKYSAPLNQNQHLRLFHDYSAPNLGDAQKNYHHQPVEILNRQKDNKFTLQNNHFNQTGSSPTNNAPQYQKNWSNPNSNEKNNYYSNLNHQEKGNKYLNHQQAPSPTFMKKFGSDKLDDRLNMNKNAQNDNGLAPERFASFGKKLNFNKTEKQSVQSPVTTEENTPVKQKFVVSPAFFKNRQNKVFSDTKTEQNYPLDKHSYNTKASQQTINIASTLSDEGSNESLQYLNDDFISQTQKQWSLEDFQMGDKLGKGAFGDVYIARQKHLGFMCVLKKMSKRRIKEQQREQHVIRQLKIQMYLNHKHLTSMYGYFHDKDNIYLILEYLPDGNLSQMKRRKKTCQKQTADILKQVCEGLSFMHKLSVIHRDIKPENIFVNEGYMKLGDFGCSVFTDGLRKTVVSCLEYSSPQQMNNGYYNQKIDVWGVGILAFELLTGKSPFENKIMNMAQGNQKVDFSDLKFPEQLHLSQLAKDFIVSLLSVDPIDRLDIQEALEHKFITSNTSQVAHLD